MRHFLAIRTSSSVKFDSSLTLLLLLILLGFLSFPGKASPEKAILVEFKSSLSDPDGLLSDWVPLNDSGDHEHCSWTGIACDDQFRVSSLEIFGGNSFNVSEYPFYGVGIRRTFSAKNGILIGKFPPVIAKLKKLRVLSLPFHKFTGEISPDIWGLEDLDVLDLEGNFLSGYFPVSFKGLMRLRVLNLGLNRLRGEIPASFSRLLGLELLNLAANELDGSIPVFVGRYRKLRGLYLSMNRLKGEIPDIWGNNCWNLRYLDLSENALYGEIPRNLGKCQELRVLSLASNALQGFIPRDLGGLRKLQVLDISRNRLSGYIPAELGNCRDLSVLVLSNPDDPFSVNKNLFRGSIPMEILALPKLRMLWVPRESEGYVNLVNVDSSSNRVRKLGNSRLLLESNPSSDEALANDEPPPRDDSDYSDNRFNPIEIASIVSASVIVFVLFALVVFFIYTRKCAPRDSSRIQVYERREIKVFTDIGVPLNFQHVVKATDCFSAGKCIGCGGFGATYKAEISPGVVVAVKKLAVGRFHCIQQFHAEIKTLGRIRHPNLVTLIGYHASEMEMFLIYNYLPGGNLEKFIQERSSKLIKWNVIHKIALDVAHAIAYLHDECNPRVIHRDVKPSNILLDNDFNAYLSDFGLSRLLENSETHATTGVAGTFGYLAPEYAMTCRVSEKADVYSYGVVLLELISDKKALDPSFSSHGNGFNIVSWAHMLLRQGRAKEVFTAGIWESGPHDDLVEVLHLAVRCTIDSLTVRPTMKQVVQQLKQLRPIS